MATGGRSCHRWHLQKWWSIGGALGAVFGAYYQVDYLEHIVSGIVYGASAAGLYDVGEAATRTVI